jgi:uncharacterized protein YkwD
MSISSVLSRTWRNVVRGDSERTGGRPPARRRRRSSAAVVTAMVLGVLAPLVVSTAPANASAARRGPSRTAAEASIGKSVRNLINVERARHGLPPVHMNSDLLKSARVHDLNMARANEMSHQLAGEASFGERMDNAGYHWTWAGENIAWNSRMTRAGVLELEKMMYNEHAPNNGHRLNILSKHFRNVGVDVYLDKAHHKVWLTTDFGHL